MAFQNNIVIIFFILQNLQKEILAKFPSMWIQILSDIHPYYHQKDENWFLQNVQN